MSFSPSNRPFCLFSVPPASPCFDWLRCPSGCQDDRLRHSLAGVRHLRRLCAVNGANVCLDPPKVVNPTVFVLTGNFTTVVAVLRLDIGPARSWARNVVYVSTLSCLYVKPQEYDFQLEQLR